MDIKKEVGRRLRQEREALGLGLKDFKQDIPELSISRLSNYEHGERMLPVEVAIKLEKKLKVSASYLLTITDNKQPDIENELERQLIMFFRTISEENRDDLINYANYLYNKDHPNDLTANPTNGKKKKEAAKQ